MSGRRDPRFLLLCFGFVVCGMVTVLPGPLLPVMAARWGLRDVQSGGFFAAEFLASTVASIFSPHWLRRNLPLGYASMTAGVGLLTVAEQTLGAAVGHHLALIAFALIGLGIGLSVTATNLTVGMMAGSLIGSGERARLISVVNLWWGIGAVVCPWLIAAAERWNYLPALLILLAVAAAGMFAALLPQWREPEFGARCATRTSLRSEARVLLFFAILLFLYVGVETVVGGWITTYAHRFSGMTVAGASLMVSLYWLALLAGRWAGSVALRSIPERTLWLPSIGISFAAVLTLIAPHSQLTVMIAIAAAGAGFGPVFPIGLSRMLGRLQDHRNTGWVFAMTASGGAVLPWLTGLLSTKTGSLRLGFAVPVVGLAAIFLLVTAENAVLSRPRS